MNEGRVSTNGIELCYQSLGDPSGPPLLLVMGLGMQLIHWDLELCEQFVDEGYHVIRFDNRDAGLSTQIAAPVPPIMRAMAGFHIDAPYLLTDMAADTFGLLDGLGIERAHVMGVSMGGMIGQTMAIARPERLLSLTSIMSTTGERRAGMPKLRTWSLLMRRAPDRRDAFVEYFVRLFRMIGSPGFPQDEPRIRELAAATFDRNHASAGTARQLAGILASGDRTPQLRRLRVPTTVIHGTDDPLVPFRGGVATARAIPDAELVAIPGMGHDLPREIWPKLIEAVARNSDRAAAASPA
ncbi:MAG: alpha/beta hydrolase [Thermoleophilaceae bacterium]